MEIGQCVAQMRMSLLENGCDDCRWTSAACAEFEQIASRSESCLPRLERLQ